LVPLSFLVARVRKNPLITPIHSLLKKASKAAAVPRCSTTKKGRKVGDSWFTCQPRSEGSMTLWPRLETGKISVAPCNRANQNACQMLKTRVLPRKVYEVFGYPPGSPWDLAWYGKSKGHDTWRGL